MRMEAVCAFLIFLLLELFNRQIIEVFWGADGTAVAISTGRSYLTFRGYFFCLIGFKIAVDGLLRGAGDMKMFTIANLVNLFIRVFIAMVFAPRYGIQMIWYGTPLGWLANRIVPFMQYRTGKWKKHIGGNGNLSAGRENPLLTKRNAARMINNKKKVMRKRSTHESRRRERNPSAVRFLGKSCVEGSF